MKKILVALSFLLPFMLGEAQAGCADAKYVCSAKGYKDISGYEFTVPCCCCEYVPYPKCHTCDVEDVVFAKYCRGRTVTIKVMHENDPFAHTIMHYPAESYQGVDEGCYF